MEKAMPGIMTTQEVAEYLKLHEVTICKYAGEGAIPAKRIGGVWRFDKDVLDRWISEGLTGPGPGKRAKRKVAKK